MCCHHWSTDSTLTINWCRGRICTLLRNEPAEARTIAREEYPFAPSTNAGRQYSERQCLEVFLRDGFTDRKSGAGLVFAATRQQLYGW